MCITLLLLGLLAVLGVQIFHQIPVLQLLGAGGVVTAQQNHYGSGSAQQGKQRGNHGAPSAFLVSHGIFSFLRRIATPIIIYFSANSNPPEKMFWHHLYFVV